MKLHVLLGGLLLVLALPAGPSLARADQLEVAKSYRFKGKLTQLDDKKRTIIVVADAPGLAFTVSADATIVTKESPSASLNDLKIGAMLLVIYHQESDGLVADRIEVVL